jgi:drug/metabolite transporter (DMT)-like permease
MATWDGLSNHVASIVSIIVAAVTSLGLLATPVVGTLSAAIALGEPITLALLGAMTLIVGGIALGTIMRPR